MCWNRDAAERSPEWSSLTAKLRLKGLSAIPKSVSLKKPGTSGTLWLGVKPSPELDRLFTGLPEPQEQGYRLMVGDDWVVIQGKDVQGLYYGLMTLLQLTRSDGSIAKVKISDWPELKLRGTYIAEDNPEKKIEYFASMKLNFIVFEYTELYQLDQPKPKARWKKIADECRRHFIEPIPELQSFGHGTTILGIEPRCLEASYVSNMPVMARQRMIQAEDGVVSDLKIINAGFDQNRDGNPTGWTVDNNNDGIAVEQSEKYPGQSSLRISIQNTGMLRSWQIMPCQARCRYELSCMIKTKDVRTNNNQYAGAYAEVYGVDSNGGLSPEPLGRTTSLKGTTDWQRMSCSIGTAGYSKVCIFIRLQDATGASWFDDVSMKGIKHDDAIVANAVITKSARIVVTDPSDGTKYAEGKDYNLQIRRAKKGIPSIQLTIPRNSGIRDGERLTLSFNSSYEGAQTCCPSEPLYREIMRRSIRNVINCMKPNYLHIGHDEPQAINRDSRCTERKLSNAEIYADDIKRMHDYVAEADPKCRMMMWDDTLNPFSNAPIFQLEKAAQMVPKDIIMCAWAYSYPGENEKIQKSVDYWLKLGFDITGSPWFDKNNCRFWADELIKNNQNRQILGYFYTAWMDNTERTWDGLQTAAQTSWSGTR